MDERSVARSPRPDTPREHRECRSCNGHGLVLLDADYDPTTGELVQEVAECFICKGEGSVPLFMYATPRRSR